MNKTSNGRGGGGGGGRGGGVANNKGLIARGIVYEPRSFGATGAQKMPCGEGSDSHPECFSMSAEACLT